MLGTGPLFSALGARLLFSPLLDALPRSGLVTLPGIPEGYAARLLAALAASGREVLFIARDETRMDRAAEVLAFFEPECQVLPFPAWDNLPYDRLSPGSEAVAQRVDSLTRLAGTPRQAGRVVLSTVAAAIQRVPPRAAFEGRALTLKIGTTLALEALLHQLGGAGYIRVDTVMEPGEYAVRGGIVDIFPPGMALPARLDFFGDELDGIRLFAPDSQRTAEKIDRVVIKPVSEVFLDPAAIARFRQGYQSAFGKATSADPIYDAVSDGRRAAGMEHFLPLFHDGLETLLDYVPGAVVVLDHGADEARDARLEQIAEHLQARQSIANRGVGEAGAGHALPPDRLYLDAEDWAVAVSARPVVALTSFDAPEGAGVVELPARTAPDFSDVRTNPDANVFDAVAGHVRSLAERDVRVILAAWSAGSRDRLASVFKEHGFDRFASVETFPKIAPLPKGVAALTVLGLETGFSDPEIAVITEQDILGDRLVRPSRRRMRAENFIAEASALNEGDLVVHLDHGIGRYEGLVTVTAGGAPHDCLCLIYDGDDKLFVPVENIEVLSRYGADQGVARLDKLGGVAWQARKAKLKQRVRDMADKLIQIAAARHLEKGAAMAPPEGLFDEFCARFPYVETDDQRRAIGEVIEDLSSGRNMDRLVCGDVGFGKTEVALRAAFVAAMAGLQTAVVVPTTLLARQHYQSFAARFRDFPVRVAQLSRFVSAKDARLVKAGMEDGTVDIVVGTHALLAKSITFKRIGLLVVDEEQHFGVAHKERLKSLKADVHVLTLTATPIPRTLQMALAGVRELSLIATPPVDRLAVRTYVLPHDPVALREAILREHYRGGQTFYVCPRISDIDGVAEELEKLVPEVKVGVAHGRLSPTELENIMTAFSDGRFDVLLSTNIVESGLDLPSANTLIVHRADRFGLSQLYQLRGRVGRSKLRAYAYLTLPPRQRITPAAEKRLNVMRTLDTLGAGFTLASHDLDIRGAGNLLGEEQSGHIKEVGVELYQRLLEEAVAQAKGVAEEQIEETWSPQINLGVPVLIPETYIPDLGARMGLYRRLADLQSRADVDEFAAEMVDRFGKLPEEVENLLRVVTVKIHCKAANIEKLDVGPKGAVIGFRDNRFTDPGRLVAFITAQSGTAKLRPDHKLVFMRGWETARQRMEGAAKLAAQLAEISGAAKN
ncbi:MAG: transcription-repair coupling factor [Magnetospiraceae bacterium]